MKASKISLVAVLALSLTLGLAASSMARPGGGMGTLQLVVTGNTDYRLSPQSLTGTADGDIIPAEVYPGGTARRRQFDIIVDDQGDITLAAQGRQCLCIAAACLPGQVFLAVLYQYRPSIDGQ